MADTEIGTPQEPVSANAMTLTRVTGFAAVITTVGTALTAALGGLQREPTAIVIAILGGITVGLIVAGFALVTDMRIRSQQTIATNYLRYLQKHGKMQENGHAAALLSQAMPGAKVAADEGDLIWQVLLATRVDPEAGGGVGSGPRG
jgi:hypothetical protein